MSFLSVLRRRNAFILIFTNNWMYAMLHLLLSVCTLVQVLHTDAGLVDNADNPPKISSVRFLVTVNDTWADPPGWVLSLVDLSVCGCWLDLYFIGMLTSLFIATDQGRYIDITWFNKTNSEEHTVLLIESISCLWLSSTRHLLLLLLLFPSYFCFL